MDAEQTRGRSFDVRVNANQTQVCVENRAGRTPNGQKIQMRSWVGPCRLSVWAQMVIHGADVIMRWSWPKPQADSPLLPLLANPSPTSPPPLPRHPAAGPNPAVEVVTAATAGFRKKIIRFFRNPSSVFLDRFAGFSRFFYLADVRPYVRLNERFSSVSYR